MKSQEQRIKDGIEAARSAVGCHLLTTSSVERLVRDVLEAADREMPQPKWPTDESIRRYRRDVGLGSVDPGDEPFEASRHAVRAAFLADPIIKAAIGYVRAYGSERANLGRPAQALIDAVNEAGL